MMIVPSTPIMYFFVVVGADTLIEHCATCVV